MSYASKGIWISFAIHTSLFAVIAVLGGIVSPIKRPIVIDFNIATVTDAPKGEKEDIQPKKNQVIKKTKTEVKKNEDKLDKTETLKDTLNEHPVEPLASSSVSAVQPHGDIVSKGGVSAAASPKTEAQSESKQSGSAKSVNAEATGKAKYLKEHFSYIRNTIMKNISYPRIARKMGWEGKVVVSFVINEDGSVDNVRIVESCGNNILDKDAIETVKRASPFPKPPVKAEIFIPVVYRLT